MSRPRASLANLDLNLVVFLRELLRERNVTRAAERIGVTQPAASAALLRLRRHFADELLVRNGAQFVLSPLAEQLAGQVEPVCEGLEALFVTTGDFRPEDSQREFTLLMPDYAVCALGESLSRAMYRAAPGTRLHVKIVNEALPTDPLDTLRVIDGIISAPTQALRTAGIRDLELFRDRWVCVIDRHHPAAERLALPDLEELPWVVPHHPDGGYPASYPLTPLLSRLSRRPRVAVRVDSYRATPYFVAGTDRVAVMQRRLAVTFADHPDLVIVPCPGDPPEIVECLWWHHRVDDDPSHRWLRGVVRQAARISPDTDLGMITASGHTPG
ncbi:LysR family transcriptional regulator [Actinomycetospora sp. NBRC 106375]|uniref:LysR family transcriptional regulator n=1 Tax=Actinomycetospora sp. NBRC 106375 TaxID=3032207 RepID=UPI0024A5C152|nr:LysR family transcriptional regulator [Actinomycetospora sp. NBRC 106375]GLZ47873.1 LysR family transcriptional regulator [Actinomycetospora sp. NBRC 106375]